MPKKTQTTTNDSATKADGSLYDTIMAELEPDLMTENFTDEKLNEKYKNESPQKRKLRYKHYDAVLDAFDDIISRIERKYVHRAIEKKAEIRTRVKEREEEERTEELAEMEKLIDEET